MKVLISLSELLGGLEDGGGTDELDGDDVVGGGGWEGKCYNVIVFVF